MSTAGVNTPGQYKSFWTGSRHHAVVVKGWHSGAVESIKAAARDTGAAMLTLTVRDLRLEFDELGRYLETQTDFVSLSVSTYRNDSATFAENYAKVLARAATNPRLLEFIIVDNKGLAVPRILAALADPQTDPSRLRVLHICCSRLPLVTLRAVLARARALRELHLEYEDIEILRAVFPLQKEFLCIAPCLRIISLTCVLLSVTTVFSYAGTNCPDNVLVCMLNAREHTIRKILAEDQNLAYANPTVDSDGLVFINDCFAFVSATPKRYELQEWELLGHNFWAGAESVGAASALVARGPREAVKKAAGRLCFHFDLNLAAPEEGTFHAPAHSPIDYVCELLELAGEMPAVCARLSAFLCGCGDAVEQKWPRAQPEIRLGFLALMLEHAATVLELLYVHFANIAAAAENRADVTETRADTNTTVLELSPEFLAAAGGLDGGHNFIEIVVEIMRELASKSRNILADKVARGVVIDRLAARELSLADAFSTVFNDTPPRAETALASAEASTSLVRLVASDGVVFEIPQTEAARSAVLAAMFEAVVDPVSGPISIPFVARAVEIAYGFDSPQTFAEQLSAYACAEFLNTPSAFELLAKIVFFCAWDWRTSRQPS